MPLEADPIRLTKQQRMELNEIARSLSLPAGFVLPREDHPATGRRRSSLLRGFRTLFMNYN